MEGRRERAPGPPTPEMLESWERIGGNVEYFLAHGLREITGFGSRPGPFADTLYRS
jgi:hypothetical protein